MNGKNRKKILLVEDSPLPQQVVKTLLQQLDCIVDVAATGEDSVALCKKNRYDLIFMDIGLPGIDGFMAAKLIRQQEEGQGHVSIVALTAHNNPETKTQALTVGMDDFFVKPLTKQSAKAIIKKYCSAKGLNKSLIKK
jgi:two-component system aerobic respiration control sensor histidine kinase ArcB